MCDPVVVRMSVSDKQQENPNGFKSKGGGGGVQDLAPSFQFRHCYYLGSDTP